jgi:hypothetical protein
MRPTRSLLVHQRLALATFHTCYQVARENSGLFRKWLKDNHQAERLPLKATAGRTPDAIVKQGFIAMMSPTPENSAARRRLKYCAKNWHAWGRSWAELIIRLGYGSLLLVPENMTSTRYWHYVTPCCLKMQTADGSVRVKNMPMNHFSCLVDAIEARRASFEEPLAMANEMMMRALGSSPKRPTAVNASRTIPNFNALSTFQ